MQYIAQQKVVIVTALGRVGRVIPLPTWDATGDLTLQSWHRWLTDTTTLATPPPPPHFFFLQIYMIHMNDLFQGENGEFRPKVTSIHHCNKQLVNSENGLFY